jgi:methylglutaconyl-CoA hydratase
MKDFETILFDISDSVARVTMNRPDVHNAFNDQLLTDLIDVFTEIKAMGTDVRVVVITGEGKSFCAGADLKWMRKMIDFSYEENIKDSNLIADCMYGLYTLPQPTIARVNGSAIGGGMGLVTASDIAIAADHAKFSLSEVKLGLVPACISPYVIMRAGPAACREFFLTGERLTAEKAHRHNLVNKVVPMDELDATVDEYIDRIKSSGPNALSVCKDLIHNVYMTDLKESIPYTVDVIARLRISDEGQEGMHSFFEKRKPRWAE